MYIPVIESSSAVTDLMFGLMQR